MREGRRPAAAQAALRDLPLFAARRGRPHALRQGGARRPALVRPAAGFPHRGARPRQGAAGEERRDRAGGREGRLRAQAPAASERSAGLACGRHREPTASSSARCCSSPTISSATMWCRRPIRCGTTATIRISWWRPTRARRPSPTPPTRCRRKRAIGSATPSRPAAARATTTRRWASRPAAPGKRSSAISARWTSTSSREPVTVAGVGDMSGDVFGNGMLLSRKLKLVAAFDHRDIFLDPDPDPETLLRRARAPVRPAPLELAGLRQGADLEGRRHLLAQRQIDSALRGSPRAARDRQGRRRRPPRS